MTEDETTSEENSLCNNAKGKCIFLDFFLVFQLHSFIFRKIKVLSKSGQKESDG